MFLQVLVTILLSSYLSTEDKSDIVRRLRNFGCHCAMVGYEFLDHDAIGESHIGISVADATDYTKSESDLVLTQPALMPVSSAVQISRKICQMLRSYTVGHSDAFRGLISDKMFYIWIIINGY